MSLPPARCRAIVGLTMDIAFVLYDDFTGRAVRSRSRGRRRGDLPGPDGTHRHALRRTGSTRAATRCVHQGPQEGDQRPALVVIERAASTCAAGRCAGQSAATPGRGSLALAGIVAVLLLAMAFAIRLYASRPM